MRTLIVAALLAFSMLSPRAGGLIVVQNFPGGEPRIYPPPHWPRPIPPPRHFPLAPLEMSSERIDARVKDQVAIVSIDQEFYNPNSQSLEGTFLFPLPKGAQLDKFKMEIGGKMVEAELLSAEKARGIYEDIVRRAKDPALMEFEGRDCLRVKIFPIEANGRKKVHLSYTQLLKLDSGLVDFRLPISSEKYSAKPIEHLSLNLDVESATPLKTIYSPSHNVDVQRPSPRRATLKLDEKQLADEKDFELIYGAEKSEVEIKVLTHRDEGDGYFLMFASPGIDASEQAVVAKDVAFVLDTSGSMSGQKIEQARNALLFCVRNLNEQDRFEVLRFSTETEPLFHELRPANKENVQKAESFIEKLQAQNGTAIDDALRQVLELRGSDSSRPFVVIFLTDGLPTVGEVREEKILANVRDRAKSTRVFCFGIGNDVNTHLLDKIAEDTRAFSQYVMTGEDIEVKVSSFFSKIRDPLLANLKIDVSGGDVRLTKQYPSALPDLFKGEQLILSGRYSGSGKATVKLKGTVNGEERVFTEKIEFPEKDSDYEFIPRLWATRRVGALLDQIRLNGENKELRDEITDLARQYGIVTPYTAYLIMEDEAARGVPVRAQSLPAAAAIPEVRQQLSLQYDNYLNSKSGELAVDAAANNQMLRQAQNAEPMAHYRYFGGSPTAAKAGRNGGQALSNTTLASPAVSAPEAIEQQATKFAAGRAFYQNGSQWIDNQVQKLNNASTNRIKFNSDAYFAFVAKNPALNSVLSLGSNVQFVHNGQIIEIQE